jgi:hypothetical protein
MPISLQEPDHSRNRTQVLSSTHRVRTRCPRRLELEDELLELRRRLAAAGFRAGWARLARFVRPGLREWEARSFRSMRDNDRPEAQIGILLRETNRLSDGA